MKGASRCEGQLQRLDLGVGVWVLDDPMIGRVQLSFPPGAAPSRALDGARVAVVGALTTGQAGVGMAATQTFRVESWRPLP